VRNNRCYLFSLVEHAQISDNKSGIQSLVQAFNAFVPKSFRFSLSSSTAMKAILFATSTVLEGTFSTVLQQRPRIRSYFNARLYHPPAVFSS